MLSISPNHPLGHWCHLFHFSTCCHLPIHCSYYFKQTVTWLRIKKIKAFSLPLFIPSLSLCHISNLHHLPSSWRPFSFLKHLVMKPEMLTSKSEKKSKQKNFSQWFLFQRISISISGRSTECRTEVSHMEKSIVNWEVLSQVLFGEYWLCGLILYINLLMLHTLVLTLIWTLSNWRVILNVIFPPHEVFC